MIGVLFIYCVLMLVGRLSELTRKFVFLLDTGFSAFFNELLHVVVLGILAIDFGLRIFSVTHTGLW